MTGQGRGGESSSSPPESPVARLSFSRELRQYSGSFESRPRGPFTDCSSLCLYAVLGAPRSVGVPGRGGSVGLIMMLSEAILLPTSLHEPPAPPPGATTSTLVFGVQPLPDEASVVPGVLHTYYRRQEQEQEDAGDGVKHR